MAFKNFIPTVWSTKLLRRMDNSLVYADLVNRDYEGEIAGAGDTVKIGQMGRITVSAYTGQDIVPEQIDTTQTTLLIDQQDCFAFYVDDVDKAQANVTFMDKAMSQTGYDMRDVVDTFVANLGVAGAGTTLDNSGSPYAVNSSNIVELIATLGEKMTDLNVPDEGRWLVIPPWMHTKLVLAEVIQRTNNDAVFINGKITNALGFDIRKSNKVPNTNAADYQILAGTNEAISFAQQLVNIEAYRPEKAFRDAIKGLQVYGGKVLQPKALCVLRASIAAEA